MSVDRHYQRRKRRRAKKQAEMRKARKVAKRMARVLSGESPLTAWFEDAIRDAVFARDPVFARIKSGRLTGITANGGTSIKELFTSEPDDAAK